MGCCSAFVPSMNPGGSGGGGGGGDSQRFTYQVTGAEPDLAELVIPLPVVRPSATYLVFPAQANCASQLTMNVTNASRTVNQFVLSLSAVATIGDIFAFDVADPT